MYGVAISPRITFSYPLIHRPVQRCIYSYSISIEYSTASNRSAERAIICVALPIADTARIHMEGTLSSGGTTDDS